MRTIDFYFQETIRLMKLSPDEQANIDCAEDGVIAYKNLIQQIQDEAVAHGMTLAAEIAENYNETVACDLSHKAIRLARDNKVWRKE